MKTTPIFAKGIAALGIFCLTLGSASLRAEESLGEKVSDTAKEAWDATKKTAKKVERSIENKVDELRSEEVAHKGNKVEVTLEEHRITMPSAIPAGLTTFVITNKGKEKHGFEIDGKKVDRELSKSLQPGETAMLTVELPAGKYKAECPVAENEEKGMKQEFVVK